MFSFPGFLEVPGRIHHLSFQTQLSIISLTIHVHGDIDGRVAHLILNVFGMFPLGNQKGSKCVSQIVKTDFPESCSSLQFPDRVFL